MIVTGFESILDEAERSASVAYLALSEDFGGSEEETGRLQLVPLDRSTLRRLRHHLTPDDFADGYDASHIPPALLEHDDGQVDLTGEDWSNVWRVSALVTAGCHSLRELAAHNTFDTETRWRLRCYGGTPRRVHWRHRFRIRPGDVAEEDDAPRGPQPPDLAQLAPTPHVSTAVTPADSAPPPEADRYSDVDTQFNQFGGHLQVIGDHWDRFGANLAKYYDHMLEQQRVVGERMDQRYGKFLEQSELQILRLLKAASDSHEQVLNVLKQRETEERLRIHDQSELETARDQRRLVGELAKDGLGKLSNIGEMVLMNEMGMDPQLVELGKLVAANPELAEKLKDPDLIALLQDPEIAGQVGDVLGSLAEAGRAQRTAREQAEAEAAARAKADAEAPPAPAPAPAPPPPGAAADPPAGDATPPNPEPGPSAEPS